MHRVVTACMWMMHPPFCRRRRSGMQLENVHNKSTSLVDLHRGLRSEAWEILISVMILVEIMMNTFDMHGFGLIPIDLAKEAMGWKRA